MVIYNTFMQLNTDIIPKIQCQPQSTLYHKIAALLLLSLSIISCNQNEVPTGKMPLLFKLGETAPDFAFKSLSEANTTTQTLTQQQGKVIYLDFWASWCKPCVKSMPALNKIRSELNLADFEIVAVNLDKDFKEARAFMAKYPVDYPVVHALEVDIAQLYQINGLPTSYLIDKQGTLRFSHQGFKPQDISQIKQQILSLINIASQDK